MTETADRISQLKHAIASTQRDTDRLLAQHGSGVRSSWVSTDIAINNNKIANYTREIQKLEMKQ